MENKFLVYMCVFYNDKYFKLLNLLLISMKYFCDTRSFDILLITNPGFEEHVNELAIKIQLNIKVYTRNFTTIFEAACARLHIFDYEGLQQYSKILYLDTDIILKSNIHPVFELDLQDLLYALESGTIESPNFGCQFFDFTTISPSTVGLNSGTLLFNNSPVIRDLFSRIRKHIETFTDSGCTPPYCLDQPFINYHAIKDGLYNNTLLNPHISLYEGEDTVFNYETSSICHFSFPIGIFDHKYRRMKIFLDKILHTKTDTSPIPQVYNKRYTFGNDSRYFIKFNENNTLDTTWGPGEYIVFGKYFIQVFWNNYYHMIKMNDTYTEYICVCVYPLEFSFSSGSLLD